MYVIGLTGGLAAGKTTLSQRLKQKGYAVVDADEVTADQYKQNHELINEIEQSFPNAVHDHQVNQSELGIEISGKPEKLQKLEEITYHYILEQILAELQQKEKEGYVLTFLVAPLLFETNLGGLCHASICLYTSEKEQRRRAFLREGMTEEKFSVLVKRQWPTDKKKELASYSICNECSEEKTEELIDSFLKKFFESHS